MVKVTNGVGSNGHMTILTESRLIPVFQAAHMHFAAWQLTTSAPTNIVVFQFYRRIL